MADLFILYRRRDGTWWVKTSRDDDIPWRHRKLAAWHDRRGPYWLAEVLPDTVPRPTRRVAETMLQVVSRDLCLPNYQLKMVSSRARTTRLGPVTAWRPTSPSNASTPRHRATSVGLRSEASHVLAPPLDEVLVDGFHRRA